MSEMTVLIVEDDRSLREALVETIELAGFQGLAAQDAQEALEIIARATPNLIVSDVQMPGMDGYQLLQTLKQQTPEMPIILMTADGSITDAVKAMKLGALDYLVKPFEPNSLVDKINSVLPQTTSVQAPLKHSETSGPIAQDLSSQQLLNLAKRVAPAKATLLITGQSGTGKEVLARYIHQFSQRKDQPFVAVNCAAIPENMLEATLFGYEKGAFTGAHQSYAGKFEQAQGGTLLLDEISEMDLNLQAKLLRVIQEKEVERLGGKKLMKLDVRLIATSNKNLPEEVKKGKFREDLFYRVNVFPLRWLPLNQRPKDIIPMAEYFITRALDDSDKQSATLSKEAMTKLKTYAWPGNGRELDNVIQRALLIKTTDQITANDIQFEVS